MIQDFNVLIVRTAGLLTMTIKVFLTTSLVLHLSLFTGHTYAFMRLNVRAAATSHSVVAITNSYSYVKLESCPTTGPLNISCNDNYKAVRARFGPSVGNGKDLVGRFEVVSPPDACDEISLTQGASRKSSTYIAIVNNDNCSFEIKVTNAEKAGYRAVIIYANKEDKDLLNMSSSSPSLKVTIPSFYVSHETGTKLALYSSKLLNTSRPSMLLIATRRKFLSSQPNFTGKLGAINANGGDEEDGDNFGEHYFHICIYIWACVVVSSLIGLSVKWGCCGRSLTRWEVTKIPLKRFRRNSGSDYQDKCPICHEEFHEGRLIRQLPCNHCYHSYCVDRWLVKMSNRCPLCKQRVSVSLFCSWSKQRDGQGGLQQSEADLDAEEASVVGDLPPLPPVQSLTPSTLYGDVIMSGPSKFILMRPGKATRVIEVPKKDGNNAQNKQHDGNNCQQHNLHLHHQQQQQQQQQQLQQTRAIVSTPIPVGGKRDKKTPSSSPGDKHNNAVTCLSSSLSSSSFRSNSKKFMKKNDDDHDDKFTVTKDHPDAICMETLHHHHHHHHRDNNQHHHHHHYHVPNSTTPGKSSRSSSITSEHPLLTEEDHGSIVSLHSITDCMVGNGGREEEEELPPNSAMMHFASSPRGGCGFGSNVYNKEESRCIFGNDRSCCVQDSDSGHNRKMDTSDSSDYGCNCDFMDDEERILSGGSGSRRWDGGGGGGDGSFRDSRYKSRDKSVILEVNVNLSPQLFHADVEQHCSKVFHRPQQQQEQQSSKGDNCAISMSPGGACGSSDRTLNLFCDGANAGVPTTTTFCVNNCKNVKDGGSTNSNSKDGGGGGDADGGGGVCEHRKSYEEGRIFCDDDSSSGGGNRKVNVMSGGPDGGEGVGRRGCSAINSLFQQSTNAANTDATTTTTTITADAASAVVTQKKTKATTAAAADANRMSNSYPPSLRQIVATWDGNLRRGLGKASRSRSFCSSSTSRKNIQTL